MNLDSTASDLAYQSGFGNEFASEALPGALPIAFSDCARASWGARRSAVGSWSSRFSRRSKNARISGLSPSPVCDGPGGATELP